MISIKLFLKIIVTLLGFSLALFGLIGFVSNSFQSTSKIKIEKYYTQQPLNQKNGIAVDSKNNIYIGDIQTNSIQVYNELGHFQYGFNLSKNYINWFVFGIKNDKIHVITSDNTYLIFDNGNLVSIKKEFNEDRLLSEYNMIRDKKFETIDKTYHATILNSIIIKDKLTTTTEKIHLNSPIWPFSIAFFWLIGACGMLLIFITHRKLFISMTHWKNP